MPQGFRCKKCVTTANRKFPVQWIPAFIHQRFLISEKWSKTRCVLPRGGEATKCSYKDPIETTAPLRIASLNRYHCWCFSNIDLHLQITKLFLRAKIFWRVNVNSTKRKTSSSFLFGSFSVGWPRLQSFNWQICIHATERDRFKFVLGLLLFLFFPPTTDSCLAGIPQVAPVSTLSLGVLLQRNNYIMKVSSASVFGQFRSIKAL